LTNVLICINDEARHGSVLGKFIA